MLSYELTWHGIVQIEGKDQIDEEVKDEPAIDRGKRDDTTRNSFRVIHRAPSESFKGILFGSQTKIDETNGEWSRWEQAEQVSDSHISAVTVHNSSSQLKEETKNEDKETNSSAVTGFLNNSTDQESQRNLAC